MNILRPGISAKFLEQAKVRQLGPGEAANLCAISQGGIWIPYLAWDGSPLRDQSGRELGRLLVDHPEHHTVYHCSSDSREHAYLPPNINEQKTNGDLFLCDSEFRAMCLAETGFAALGLQGFWGFLAPNSRLVSEMVEAVHRLTPRRIILVGNSDSCLDYEFSKAAISLRSKLGVATLHLLRIPIHLPVGIDEVRELLKEAFSKCWSNWLDEAMPVAADTRASDLAVDLIAHEAVDGLQGQRRYEVEQKLVKLADAIEDEPLAQGRLLAFIVGDLRISQFKRALKLHRDQRLQTLKRQTTLSSPEPWAEPVDSAALLQEIRALITRFVSLTDDAATVCAVWALHTWVFEAFDFTPLLHVDSPEKGCGKSTLRRVLAQVVSNSKSTSGITEASVFRFVNQQRVTLLVDEWDILAAKERAALTKILNAGVEPDGTVDRCIGGSIETFRVFSPKAIFGIQNIGLTESTVSRTIHITLHRPLPEEKLEVFKARIGNSERLRRKCLRWALDTQKSLEVADPIRPSWMRDRTAQVWLPLIAIADQAGQDWPDAIRRSAKLLSGRAATTLSRAQLAIIDALTVFDRVGVDRMFSANLVEHLIRLADEINEQADGDFRPWKHGFKGGGALTQIRLSDLVRPYDIEPQSIRESQNPRTAKGYYKSCFQNAYKRYISRVYSNQNGTPAQNDDDQATPNISD